MYPTITVWCLGASLPHSTGKSAFHPIRGLKLPVAYSHGQQFIIGGTPGPNTWGWARGRPSSLRTWMYRYV